MPRVYTTSPAGYVPIDSHPLLAVGDDAGPNMRAVYDSGRDPCDLVGELTDDENRTLVLARGGCNCMSGLRPCSACTTPLTKREALAVLQARDEALVEAEASRLALDQAFAGIGLLLDQAGYERLPRAEFDKLTPRSLQALQERLQREIRDREEAAAEAERGEVWGAW